MTKQGLQLLLQYVAHTSRRHGVYPNPFRSSPITGPPSIPFRINTCKSVSKQTASTPFRINHLCKTRRGVGLLLTSHVGFSNAPGSQCPLCPCLPRPGRGGKSHVLSSLPPLCLSLRSFPHSHPLFSIACRLFCKNAGGGGVSRSGLWTLGGSRRRLPGAGDYGTPGGYQLNESSVPYGGRSETVNL
jgi:hypothetical protein